MESRQSPSGSCFDNRRARARRIFFFDLTPSSLHRIHLKSISQLDYRQYSNATAHQTTHDKKPEQRKSNSVTDVSRRFSVIKCARYGIIRADGFKPSTIGTCFSSSRILSLLLLYLSRFLYTFFSEPPIVNHTLHRLPYRRLFVVSSALSAFCIALAAPRHSDPPTAMAALAPAA